MMTFRTRLLYLISKPAEENEAEPHYPAGQVQQIGHIITTWTDYSFISSNARHRKRAHLNGEHLFLLAIMGLFALAIDLRVKTRVSEKSEAELPNKMPNKFVLIILKCCAFLSVFQFAG